MDVISAGGSDQCVSYAHTHIDIIIVNWNSGNQLKNCLRSIKQYRAGQTARVIVVDNASSDGSAADILDLFDDLSLEILCNAENLGFARACNQGARIGRAPYLLFLNPDAELFAQSISCPLEYMENKKNADVGICGVQLLDESGTVVRTCARFPSLGRLTVQIFGLNKIPGLNNTGMHMKEWDHAHTGNVDQVMGSFFMIRRKLFESLGGFDERFFVYFEEVDLSFRARSAGYKSVYLADAQAYHAGGGTSRQVKDVRLFYSLRSRLLYGFKHFSAWQAWALAGVTMIIEPFSRFVFCVFRRDWAGIVNTISGYKQLWRALPQIITERRQESK